MTRANNFKVIRISSVRAGFPAADAGLREGDAIVAVNNRPAARLGLDGLIKMFKQKGKEYRLTIKRGAETKSVKLRMKRVV
jgi:C-terminal processing protease CtpA/Prc